MTTIPFRTGRRAFAVGLLAVGLSACSISLFGGSGMPSGDVDAEGMTSTFLPWVNDLRKSRGLPPVSYSRSCEAAAIDQASRMALAGKMNHITGPESVYNRFKRMNLTLPAAENIAMQQRTPERAFQAWVNSPKHLENMLGPYAHVGVAMATSPKSGNTPFWSMCLSQ
ncbi:CAP domain-containing protein [Martelella endophytica]|uniref:CAP domain-containing protein n=1 Tax=Martelella endophytica TaxID=1486262 RepID=UPI000696CCF7|nr:CAP domain-containing protein [Martelella endophytica]